MGNEQSQNNCFSPRQMKQKYHSDVIEKRTKEFDDDTQENTSFANRKLKEKSLAQSVSNLSATKPHQGSITIEIKINLNGNQNYNIESLQQQIPKLIQSKGLPPTSPKGFRSTTLKNSEKLQRSTKQKESVKTADKEYEINIEDIDLPEETSYCGSELYETATN